MLAGRPATMWRYRELMPLADGESPISLGEGFTPLFHATALGRTLGLDRLYVKDESLNPTNSFKARGQSAAITRAQYLGAETIALPTAGNAGNAAAAYAAAAGLRCEVFMPRDVKQPFVDECRLYGARVTLVEGLITDAGRLAAEQGARLGWYDVSTLKEPYRIEGKKTMAYELAEQMAWQWPDWILYPTGGGTGMVGMWKAFEELEEIGWMPRGRRPRMVSVQADGCAPIVRAFEAGAGKAAAWENAATIADGLRVPLAIGDFLILRAIRESGGTAVAVSDGEMVDGMLRMGRTEGISAAPEGGATVAALRRLLAAGTIQASESVVLFNTGGALKYLEVIGTV
jgi:threonine synthase